MCLKGYLQFSTESLWIFKTVHMKMSSCKDEGDEDFIEIEVASTNFGITCNQGVFEFPIISDKSMPITSPADELFYKGKVLSQHLPLIFSAAKGVGSCKISPCESINVSRVVEARKLLADSCSSSDFGNEESEKSVRRKCRQSSLGLKFKAYMNKYFTNTYSSDKSSPSVSTIRNAQERSALNKMPKKAKEIQRGVIGSYNVDTVQSGKQSQHRRSFCGAVKRAMIPKCTSPPNRFSFSEVNEYQYIKRRDSELAEIERSIQGAIVHCKQSQSIGKFSQPICE